MYQITTSHPLNAHNVIYELYLNKAGKKSTKKEKTSSWNYLNTYESKPAQREKKVSLRKRADLVYAES